MRVRIKCKVKAMIWMRVSLRVVVMARVSIRFMVTENVSIRLNLRAKCPVHSHFEVGGGSGSVYICG